MARWLYAISFIGSERKEDALEVLQAAPEEDVPTIRGRLCVFLKLALEGKTSDAAECVGAELMSRARKVEWWSWWVAECYAFIDEQELALDWLENAFQCGFVNYPYLSEYSRIFRNLDGNPRFQELLRKVRIAREQFQL